MASHVHVGSVVVTAVGVGVGAPRILPPLVASAFNDVEATIKCVIQLCNIHSTYNNNLHHHNHHHHNSITTAAIIPPIITTSPTSTLAYTLTPFPH